MPASTISKPAHFPVQPDNIPAAMKDRAQWVCWRWTLKRPKNKPPKWDKPPLNARTRQLASSTDPTTWSTFEVAFAAYRDPANRFDGIGYVFSGQPGDFVGVDLDHCRDRESGILQPWTSPQRSCKHWSESAPEPAAIIADLATYSEVSPSQTGVKLICQGSIPASFKHGDMEIYRDGRYFTVTGGRLESAPAEIRECRAALLAIYPAFNVEPTRAAKKPKTTRTKNSPPNAKKRIPTPDTIIAKCITAENSQKFLRLFGGDILGYPSQSEAELALCGIIAYWSDGDSALIDAVFRRSKLLRDKWDEDRGGETYGQRTVRTALEGCGEFHSWSPMPKYVIGNITLVVKDTRVTPTKLIVNLELEENGKAVDVAQLTNAASGRTQAAQRILSRLGKDAPQDAARLIDSVLGSILVAESAKKVTAASGKRISDILAESVPPAIKLLYRMDGGKAYSGTLEQPINRGAFVERFMNNEILQLAATAADAPVDQTGAAKRGALIKAVDAELRILWGDLTTHLGTVNEATLSDTSSPAVAYRQAIVNLFKKPAAMGIHEHPRSDGNAVQIATRNSLATRVQKSLANFDYSSRARWIKIHEGYDAYFRVQRGPTAGEIAIYLAMKFELAAQIGIAIPDTVDLKGLQRLGKKFGAIAPKPLIPTRVTGGRHLAVLSPQLTEYILAEPIEDDSSTLGDDDSSVSDDDTSLSDDGSAAAEKPLDRSASLDKNQKSSASDDEIPTDRH